MRVGAGNSAAPCGCLRLVGVGRSVLRSPLGARDGVLVGYGLGAVPRVPSTGPKLARSLAQSFLRARMVGDGGWAERSPLWVCNTVCWGWLEERPQIQQQEIKGHHVHTFERQPAWHIACSAPEAQQQARLGAFLGYSGVAGPVILMTYPEFTTMLPPNLKEPLYQHPQPNRYLF